MLHKRDTYTKQTFVEHDDQWSSVGEFSNQSLGVTGEGGGSSQEPPLSVPARCFRVVMCVGRTARWESE